MAMSTPADLPRLLILDDELPVGRTLVRIVRRAGWVAEHAATVSDFQMRLIDFRPDAIMLDLNLGDTDGVEQLRYLVERGFSGPIVLLSGFDGRVLDAAREVGRSLGLQIRAVLRKPASLDEIAAVMTLIGRDRTTAPNTV